MSYYIYELGLKCTRNDDCIKWNSSHKIVLKSDMCMYNVHYSKMFGIILKPTCKPHYSYVEET